MATVKKSKKKIVIPICIVLVIAIIAGSVFAYAKTNNGEQVSLYTIGTGDIDETVSVTGDVSAGAVKEYKVGAVATVKEVFVKVGDSVKKDDVLATFDTDSLNSQVNSLQTSYNDTLKNYNQAVKAQKDAKIKVDELASEINDLEKQVAKLEKNASTTATTAKATSSSTAKATTTEKTTKATTKKTTTKKTTTKATTTSTTTTKKASSTSTTKRIITTQNTLPSITPSLPSTSALTTASGTNYNVYLTVAPSSSYGTVSGDGSYSENSKVTIVATPNAGYEFAGWYSNVSEIVNGTPISTDKSYSFYISGNRSFVAYFTVSTDPNNTTSTTQPQSSSTTKTDVSIPSTDISMPSTTEKNLTTTELTTVSVSDSIKSISDSLKNLNDTFALITDDVSTMTALIEVVSTSISDAIASGQLDNEKIAELVAEDVTQAIKDGIIDSTTFLVESGVAVKMIEAAVAQIDFQGITDTIVNSNNASLTAGEIQLAALYAQYEIYSVRADETVVDAQKQALNATKTALDVLKEQQAEMSAGWKAAFDGVITAVDITPGESTTALASGITLENLNELVVTVSLGEYDVHKVNVGMSATITTAYGKYDGEVATIAPTATGGSSTSILDSVGSMAGISGLSSLTDSGAGVECTVTVDDPDENIIAGFDADVEIMTGEYRGITVVPIESITLEKTGTYVYLYNEEENTVTKTQIETGAISDSVYEVTAGLNVGDKIVKTPSTDYEEETFKVKVVNEK
ncbi:MAG: biotin/lipoyl-binding protein [Eubacterium sp.]